MTKIPDDFIFSQSNLQDYLECPRRFELSHLLKIKCPAIQSEPYFEIERRAEIGRSFHNLIHQYQMGMDLQTLEQTITDSQLEEWIKRYSEDPLIKDLPAKKYLEFTLQSSLAGYRIMAKYDLLAIDNSNQVIILDWKTNPKRTRTDRLLNRVQSRIYPLVCILASQNINEGIPIEAGAVKMVYWFTNFPDEPEFIRYNEKQLENDRQYICSLIDEVSHKTRGGFELTTDENKCVFCTYRSLCNRGIKAGNINEGHLEFFDTESDSLLFDITQVDEIEF